MILFRSISERGNSMYIEKLVTFTITKIVLKITYELIRTK